MIEFAREALEKSLRDPKALNRALGEYLSEPKAQVWFDGGHSKLEGTESVRLDRRTQMLYDEDHVFINGESYRAGGRDVPSPR